MYNVVLGNTCPFLTLSERDMRNSTLNGMKCQHITSTSFFVAISEWTGFEFPIEQSFDRTIWLENGTWLMYLALASLLAVMRPAVGSTVSKSQSEKPLVSHWKCFGSRPQNSSWVSAEPREGDSQLSATQSTYRAESCTSSHIICYSKISQTITIDRSVERTGEFCLIGNLSYFLNWIFSSNQPL